MKIQQESGMGGSGCPRRLRRNLVALAGAVALGVLAVVAGISNHEEPAARYVVVECQGFDALASVGGKPVSCDAAPAEADAADEAAPEQADPQSATDPVRLRAKA